MLDYLVSLALIAPVAVGVVLLARLALEGQRRLRLARQRPRAGERRTGNRLVLAPLHQPD